MRSSQAVVDGLLHHQTTAECAISFLLLLAPLTAAAPRRSRSHGRAAAGRRACGTARWLRGSLQGPSGGGACGGAKERRAKQLLHTGVATTVHSLHARTPLFAQRTHACISLVGHAGLPAAVGSGSQHPVLLWCPHHMLCLTTAGSGRGSCPCTPAQERHRDNQHQIQGASWALQTTPYQQHVQSRQQASGDGSEEALRRGVGAAPSSSRRGKPPPASALRTPPPARTRS